jgi:hypothetical protein
MLDPFLDYLKNLTPAKGLSDYYGKVVMPTLDAPGKFMRETLSPTGDQEGFNQAFNTGGRLGMSQPLTIPVWAGTSLGTAWGDRAFNQGYESPITRAIRDMGLGVGSDVAGGMGELLGQTMTDPLTYVGSGVASRAPGVVQAGEKLLQGGINTMLLAPAKLPYLGLKSLGPVGQSITGPLFDTMSRRGQLSEFSDTIKNVTSKLISGGHDLEVDMGDLANAQSGSLIPGYNPANVAAVSTALSNRMLEANRAVASAVPGLRSSMTDITNQYIRQMSGQSPWEIWRQAHMVADAAEHVQSRVTPETSTRDIYDMFRRRMDSLELLSNNRTGILASLPDNVRPLVETAFGAMSVHGRQLVNDRDTMEAGIRELWNLENNRRGGALGAYQRIPGAATGDDAVREINARLTAMGNPALTPTKDNPMSAQLLEFLRDKINDVTHNNISGALERWGAAGDPLVDNAYSLVADKTIRDRAVQLGLDGSKSRLMSGLDTAMSLWKSIQLMSPKYLLANLGSGMVMSGLAGVSPTQIARNFARNAGTMLRGEPLTLPELAQQNTRLGRDIHHVPAGIGDNGGLLADSSALRDIAGTGRDILQRIGPGWMGAGGALAGGAAGVQRAQETPDDDLLYQTAKGAAAGAAVFGTMPWLSRHFYQPVAQGTEHVLRSGALVEGRSRFLQDQVGTLMSLIQTHAPGTSPTVLSHIQDALESRGGQIGEAALDQVLNTLGAQPAARSQAVDTWRNILDQADTAGTDLSNRINFDYKKLNNFEEFARQVFPFSTWGLKAIPFFANRIAEHPLIGSAISRFEDQSQDHNSQAGLSPRFSGSSELPVMSDVWSTITGQPGRHAFYNPLRDLMPASDAARTAAFEPGDHATAYQHLSQVLDLIGLTQHPALAMAARLVGQDPGAPAEGISVRQAGPVQELTGTDLNAPGRFAEGVLRRSLGQESRPMHDSSRPCDESTSLPSGETGKAISDNDPALAPYVRAKSDRSGAVWDRALRDVDRERGTRSLSGFVAPFVTPSATLGPEEARISQARAGLLIPGDISRKIASQAASSPVLRPIRRHSRR